METYKITLTLHELDDALKLWFEKNYGTFTYNYIAGHRTNYGCVIEFKEYEE